MTTVNVAVFVTADTGLAHTDLSRPGHPSACIAIGTGLDDGQLRVFVSDPTECDRLISAVRSARQQLVNQVTADLHAGRLVG